MRRVVRDHVLMDWLLMAVVGFAAGCGARQDSPSTSQFQASAAPSAAFASLVAPLDLDVRGKAGPDQLAPLLAGTWQLRAWSESDPSAVLEGTQRCRLRHSNQQNALIVCHWEARAQGSTGPEPEMDVTFAYVLRTDGFYGVRPMRGSRNLGVYDARNRAFDQLVRTGDAQRQRLRMVFNPSGSEARFRISTLDLAYAELRDEVTMQGALVRIPDSVPVVTELPQDPSAPRVDVAECRFREAQRNNEPVVEVDLAGDLVLFLPGTQADWEVQCGTRRPNIPFQAARVEGSGGMFVTLDLPELRPSAPLDESVYLFELTALRSLLDGHPGFSIDVDDPALAEGHVGRVMILDNPPITSIHGYATHTFSSGDTVVLHVSYTGQDMADDAIHTNIERVTNVLRNLRTRSNLAIEGASASPGATP